MKENKKRSRQTTAEPLRTVDIKQLYQNLKLMEDTDVSREVLVDMKEYLTRGRRGIPIDPPTLINV